MYSRTILHCDLNNFFASAECLTKPELKDVPMAVCGSEAERHGIVLAKNELAKKFGVKTAMPVWQARLECPGLVTVSPHYERYLELSRAVRAVYEQYTDLVEPFGIDECWLDVTGSLRLFGSGEKIANELRARVKNELGLTISVGVSFNKIFAKLGSDLKKPDAVTVIGADNFRSIVWPLDVDSIIGIGPSTAKRLRAVGLLTLGDIVKIGPQYMRQVFGKCGAQMYNSAAGYDTAAVLSCQPPAKSFGRSVTPPHDLKNEQQVAATMLRLTERVAKCLRENGCLAQLVQITVRDNALTVSEKQCLLDEPTRLVDVIYKTALSLFRALYRWQRPIRSVGVRVGSLVDEKAAYQLSVFSNRERLERLERLESGVFSIRSKHGYNSIFRAGSMLAEKGGAHLGFNSDGEAVEGVF